MVSKLIKRILDIIISVIGLIILSPLLLFISLAVLILHRSSIMFRQTRPGLYGKPFTIYKSRTMKNLYGPMAVSCRARIG